ncbi:hypothetical protein [Streptomyces sp. P9-A2]|uniref:hypothetical protein n=1 Tax=Streptomyces sp. P9-A2 TaxID=3072284 RepID=UPI003FCD4B6B
MDEYVAGPIRFADAGFYLIHIKRIGSDQPGSARLLRLLPFEGAAAVAGPVPQ